MGTDVVTMPAALGAQVLAALRMAMLAGPVFSEQGRWGFVTGEGHGLPAPVVAELAALGVRPGEPVAATDVRWVHRPGADRPVPPWTAVIATIRTVACRVPVAA